MENNYIELVKSIIELAAALVLSMPVISKISKNIFKDDSRSVPMRDIKRDTAAYLSLGVIGLPGFILLLFDYNLLGALISIVSYFLFLGFWLSIKSSPSRIDILAAIVVFMNLLTMSLLLIVVTQTK